MKRVSSDETYRVVETRREGAPTLVVGDRALHSRYDPIREAERIAGAIAPGTRLVVVLGPGLGYLLEAASVSGAEVLFAAADPDLLNFVENRRAAQVGKKRPLPGRSIPARAPVETWEEALARVSGLAEGKILLLDGSIEPGREEEYETARKNFRRALDHLLERTITLTAFGTTFIENFLGNLFHGAGRFLDPADLVSRLEGQEVLLVAPGPTLEAALPVLAERYGAGGRAPIPILCVDSAGENLLQAGLEPDFLVTLDPQRITARFLASSAGAVVSLPTASAEALRGPGDVYLFGQGYPLESALPVPPPIPGGSGETEESPSGFGGSVSTFAAAVAEWAGASKLILIGQDFGFPNGLPYARGGSMEEISLERVGRFAPMESVRRKGRNRVTVETIEGRKIPTHRNLLSYLETFSQIAERIPIVQTDSRSGRIPGASFIPLPEVLTGNTGGAANTPPRGASRRLWKETDLHDIARRLAELPPSEIRRAGLREEDYGERIKAFRARVDETGMKT